MRYVIIRDDDTNALTPVDCLERLYRPFLDRGLPVNLATIPEVATDAIRGDGRPEGFLLSEVDFAARATDRPRADWVSPTSAGDDEPPDSPETVESPAARSAAGVHATTSRPAIRVGAAEDSGSTQARTVPIGSNERLVSYLRDNAGFHIVQHGCHHEYLEFDRQPAAEISRRLDWGTRRLLEAGFPRPQAFVAPYDKLSRDGLRAVARKFRVLSTGWFELRRLPRSWWPKYVLKKLSHSPHWRIGGTVLLSHPGCLLSCDRTYSTMLGGIMHYLENQQLTVLVTHWWEYFRDGRPDEPFIDFLHETASYLATHPQIKVLSFDDLVKGRFPLN